MSCLPNKRTAKLTGVVFLLIWCFTRTATAQDSPCSQDADTYQKKRYTVRQITIQTPFGGDVPFDWLWGLKPRVRDFLANVKADLPLKENKRFNNLSYSLSLDKLRQHFGRLGPGERFRIVYVVPHLKNCMDEARKLDVVYYVHTTSFASFALLNLKLQPGQVDRALLPGTIARKHSKILPAPLVGYNQSRGIFGGGRVAAETLVGPITSTEISGTASASSLVLGAGLNGRTRLLSQIFETAEWHFRQSYSDLPSDDVRRKEGTISLQGFGTTKPLGAPKVVLRFGTALEVGHLQTETTKPLGLTQSMENSAYGALKLYTAASVAAGRQSFNASYGLQLGQAGKGVHVDYIKQIVDSVYSVRFLPRDHMPLRLDAGFSAGRIDTSSNRIPTGDLFYGGNVRQNFIRGDSWQINSAPFLRSFPQGRFRNVGNSGSAGGTQFFSFNLTAAQAIWKEPLVPEELIHDPDLSTQLKLNLRGRLEDVRTEIEFGYLPDQPQFDPLKDDVEHLKSKLEEIKAALSSIAPETLTESTATLQSDAADAIDDALASTEEFRMGPDVNLVTSLVVPFPLTATSTSPSALETCVTAITELVNELSGNSQESLKARLVTLASELDEVRIRTRNDYEVLFSLLRVKLDELKSAQAQLDPVLISLGKIATELDDIEQKLQDTAPLSNALKPDQIARLRAYLASAAQFLRVSKGDVAKARSADTNEARKELNLLAEGFEIGVARLSGLVSAINKLRGTLNTGPFRENGESLGTESAKLKKYRKEIQSALRAIHYSQPQIKTEDSFNFSGRTLDTIFRELNLLAVSPVFMLDASRLGLVSNSSLRTTRFGLGSGIRFTLLSMDLTAGYSWNLHRLPNEKHGAFAFSLEVTDLFR